MNDLPSVGPSRFVPVALQIGALLHVPVFAGTPDRLKCGLEGADREPLLAIDGELTEREPAEAGELLSQDEVELVEIVCLDARDSTFNASRGIPVVSIWTKDGPAGRLEPLLAAILEAQDAHFRRYATYLDDVSELQLPGRIHAIRVSLEADARGWIAWARVDRMLAACLVYDGEVGAPRPRVEPRRPDCVETEFGPRQSADATSAWTPGGVAPR